MLKSRIPLLFACGVLLAAAVWAWTRDEGRRVYGLLVAAVSGDNLPVVVSPAGTPAEQRAARVIIATLAHATGQHESAFRVVRSDRHRAGRPAIFVGRASAVPHRRDLPVSRESADGAVRWSTGNFGVLLEAAETALLPSAASLWLEQAVGARWYVPGRIGRETRSQAQVRVQTAEGDSTPGYLSRELGGIAVDAEGRDWYAVNRLHRRYRHGHTAGPLLNEQLRGPHPELAPLLHGRRFIPPARSYQGWQPDFTAEPAVRVVARALAAAARAEPEAANVVFGLNDSYRFDQSAETLQAVAPHRYYRRMPDYSDLLFGFLNQVAAALPGTFISTYAYYWTDNTPQFAVAPTIIPFLTGDRSKWADPAWAEEDRALITRWTQAGPRVVALYDYYYGSPFFVPRPTLWAATEVIPFAHARGVRAFYAENTPNWGLDGPKPWLAAQLLWRPEADAAALLDDYYRHYWREAAGPMRAFFERCDQQWRNQPAPWIWIKYFKDDHQRLLFPATVRAELWSLIEEARRLARTGRVRERVEFTAAAFGVTEAFCAHDERRDALVRALHAPATDTATLAALWRDYAGARRTLQDRHAAVRNEHPLAVRSALLPEYLRHDPRRAAAAELLARGESDVLTEKEWSEAELDPAAGPGLAEATPLLADPTWDTLRIRDVHPFTLVDWSEPDGAWLGSGEPWEGRAIRLPAPGGPGRAVRFSECNEEALWQWHRAEPGRHYLAEVEAAARVSPGNFTFLLVSFLDGAGRHLGSGHIDRLPPGDWPAGTRLRVLVRAPPGATHVAFSLRVMRQMPGDFVEFASPALRVLPAR